MTIQSPRIRPKRRRRTLAEEQTPFWFGMGVLFIGWILRFWVRRYRVFGVENIPASGGVFVICNHTTGMDPFLLGYATRTRSPRGPGKVMLFRNPVVSFVMRRLGIFPLRQDIADASAVRAMVQLYRAGQLVLVFPEGTRSSSAEMNPFMPDFARLAIKLNATMLPAAIAGGGELMPIGTWFPRANRPVAVVCGPPFDLSQYRGRPLTPDIARDAADDMRRRVQELLTVARKYQSTL